MTKYAFLENAIDREMGLVKEAYGNDAVIMAAPRRNWLQRRLDGAKDYFDRVGDNLGLGYSRLKTRYGFGDPAKNYDRILAYNRKYAPAPLQIREEGQNYYGQNGDPMAASDRFGNEVRVDENGNYLRPPRRILVPGTGVDGYPARYVTIHGDPGWDKAKSFPRLLNRPTSFAERSALQAAAKDTAEYAAAKEMENPVLKFFADTMGMDKPRYGTGGTYYDDKSGRYEPFPVREMTEDPSSPFGYRPTAWKNPWTEIAEDYGMSPRASRIAGGAMKLPGYAVKYSGPGLLASAAGAASTGNYDEAASDLLSAGLLKFLRFKPNAGSALASKWVKPVAGATMLGSMVYPDMTRNETSVKPMHVDSVAATQDAGDGKAKPGLFSRERTDGSVISRDKALGGTW